MEQIIQTDEFYEFNNTRVSRDISESEHLKFF